MISSICASDDRDFATRRRIDGQLRPFRLRAGIINCLRQAAGGIVSRQEIMTWLYGDDVGGGPEDDRIIDVAVMQLRDLGFPINTHCGRGHSYGWTEWEVTP